MLAYISYPREFEEIASTLDTELKKRNVDTFLDKENINLTDVWRLKIESNIKRAGIFIVLYLPEAAVPERFFSAEIDRIHSECKNDIKKKLITVIFPPTKPADLPPFLKSHSILLTETRSDIAAERDGYWINQIVEEVARFKKVEKIRQTTRWRQVTARSALALGAITIVLLSISLVNTKKALKVYEESQALQKKKIPDGKTLCHSLLGKYALSQNYVFNEGVDARAVATNAAWKAINCEYNPSLGDYLLQGEEDTDFEIEAIINGKYERIATAKFHYKSIVYISNDGALVGRSFEAVSPPKDIKKVSIGNNFNKPEDFIDKKINEVIQLRNNKHRYSKTNPCVPALGETGGRTTVAFVCEGYTRTMVKMSDGSASDDTPDAQIPLGNDEGFKVKLGADPRLTLPGTPGELRVWIGSRYADPQLPTHMAQAERALPAIGKTAKVTPFAPTFELEPKESVCMEIHPTGSETRFKLIPTKIGTFNVGADVQLFNQPDCRGAPIPKWTDTLQVIVTVNSDEAFQERTKKLGEIFWEKLLEFWGLTIALFFALLLFFIRGRLKKWFSFGNDK